MSRGVSRTRTHSGAGNAPRVDDYEAAADAVSGQVCGPGVLAAGSLFGFMFGAVGMAAENAVNGTNGSQVLRQSGWAVGLAIGASLGVHSTATAHWRHGKSQCASLSLLKHVYATNCHNCAQRPCQRIFRCCSPRSERPYSLLFAWDATFLMTSNLQMASVVYW